MTEPAAESRNVDEDVADAECVIRGAVRDPAAEHRNVGRRSGRARQALVAALAIQLAFAVFGLAKAYSEPSLSRPNFDRIAVPANALPLTPESGATIAAQYAAQWKPDARLVSASMHLDWPDSGQQGTTTALPPDGFLLYVFVSGREAITINLDRRSGNLNGSVVSKQGGSVWPTLDLSAFTKSSTIAGLTADLVAGHDYRIACPNVRHQSDVSAGMVTAADGSKQPIWAVTYQQDRHESVDDVDVRLNATTGDVIAEDVTSRGCTDK